MIKMAPASSYVFLKIFCLRNSYFFLFNFIPPSADILNKLFMALCSPELFLHHMPGSQRNRFYEAQDL